MSPLSLFKNGLKCYIKIELGSALHNSGKSNEFHSSQTIPDFITPLLQNQTKMKKVWWFVKHKIIPSHSPSAVCDADGTPIRPPHGRCRSLKLCYRRSGNLSIRKRTELFNRTSRKYHEQGLNTVFLSFHCSNGLERSIFKLFVQRGHPTYRRKERQNGTVH